MKRREIIENFMISCPGRIWFFGNHPVDEWLPGLVGGADLRTYTRIQEFSEEDGEILKLELPEVQIEHVYRQSDLNRAFLDTNMPTKTGAINAFNWERPEVIDMDGLLSKIETFLKNSAGYSTLNNEQLNSLKVFFFLYTGILSCFKIRSKSLRIRVSTELPVSYCLGSSSAYAVSLAGALIHFVKRKIFATNADASDLIKRGYKVTKYKPNNLRDFCDNEKKLVMLWAYQTEELFSRLRPSIGSDSYVSTFGNIMLFTRKADWYNQPDTIPSTCTLPIILVDTGVKPLQNFQFKKRSLLREMYPGLNESIAKVVSELGITGDEILRRNFMLPIRSRSLVGSSSSSSHNQSPRNSKTSSRRSSISVAERLSKVPLSTMFGMPGTISLDDIMMMMLSLTDGLNCTNPKATDIILLAKKYDLQGLLLGSSGDGVVMVVASKNAINLLKFKQKLRRRKIKYIKTNFGAPGIRVEPEDKHIDTKEINTPKEMTSKGNPEEARRSTIEAN